MGNITAITNLMKIGGTKNQETQTTTVWADKSTQTVGISNTATNFELSDIKTIMLGMNFLMFNSFESLNERLQNIEDQLKVNTSTVTSSPPEDFLCENSVVESVLGCTESS